MLQQTGDYDATVKKFEQLRKIGVHSFYFALDDTAPRVNYDADRQQFPEHGPWTQLPDAQAYYLNKVQTEYIKAHQLKDLQMVPTNYSGSARDPYKTELEVRLNRNIRMQWTGEGMFSNHVTTASVQQAKTTYNTDRLFIWDNFPVNDSQRDRLFLNPLENSDADLYKYLEGFTSNPMIEPYASMIALQGYADYTWNPPQHHPQKSQESIIRELAGTYALASKLTTFVDLNLGWKPYRPESVESPALSKDLKGFWNGLGSGNNLCTADLAHRVSTLKALPKDLSGIAEKGFFNDSKPWIDVTGQWASMVDYDMAALQALKSSDLATASSSISTTRLPPSSMLHYLLRPCRSYSYCQPTRPQ